jgi:O-antigen ligase
MVAGSVGAVLFVALNIGQSVLVERIAGSELWSRFTSQLLSDPSARGRIVVGEKTVDAFEEAPLLGQGFETTRYWTEFEGSHDFILDLLADHGIIGIFLIPVLLLSIGRRSWDFYVFAAVFLVWCLFSHNVFDESSSLICLAIEAVEPRTSQVACDSKLAPLDETNVVNSTRVPVHFSG